MSRPFMFLLRGLMGVSLAAIATTVWAQLPARGAWLDRTTPENWNKPSAAIPRDLRLSVVQHQEEDWMDQKSLFVHFWEKEAPATRKVISRIPQETSDYKADPKARTAREIAWLIVMEEKLLAEGLERGRVEWQEVDVPATVAEILDTYDKHHDAATARLKALDESQYATEIPFTFGEKELFRATGYDLAWEFLFDKIHHRGQLSTYLRPMGSTVPSIYGPTADEPM